MSPKQLESLLRQLERMRLNNEQNLRQATELVAKQRNTVRMFKAAGYEFDVAEAMLAEMVQSLELICWRRAWILASHSEYSSFGLVAQEHPWRREPPANLLSLICDELAVLSRSGEVSEQDMTHEAVKAALRKAG
jgi:glycerol-3-phosphate dehydrogenase